MIEIFKADSIIQRDALLNALATEGIHAQSPPRDLSRKVTPTTVDISYEGYSSFFEGFSIQVPEEQADTAKKIIESFIKSTQASTAQEKPVVRYLQSFYFCSLFSLMFPFFMQAIAVYYLVKGIRAGEKLEKGKTLFSLACHIVGICWAYVFLTNWL